MGIVSNLLELNMYKEVIVLPYTNRLDLFRGLKKAESSAAVQLRSGKIGFNYFLSRIKVPGVLGLEY